MVTFRAELASTPNRDSTKTLEELGRGFYDALRKDPRVQIIEDSRDHKKAQRF